MKKIIITGAVSAIAAVSFAGTASAAPAADGPACFGGIHRSINKDGALGLNNVGELVKVAGGQGKNAAATGLCGG